MSPNVDAGSTEHTAHDVARTARLDVLTSLACAPRVSKGQSSRPLLSFGLERRSPSLGSPPSLCWISCRVSYPTTMGCASPWWLSDVARAELVDAIGGSRGEHGTPRRRPHVFSWGSFLGNKGGRVHNQRPSETIRGCGLIHRQANKDTAESHRYPIRGKE
ncbi:hypothetical protein BJX65DRAFT_98139 [Aspergillus insuetus]